MKSKRTIRLTAKESIRVFNAMGLGYRVYSSRQHAESMLGEEWHTYRHTYIHGLIVLNPDEKVR